MMRVKWFDAVVAGAILFGLAALSSKAELVTMWSDGFESGDFSAWTAVDGNWQVITSEQSAHSGLRGADITGSTAPGGDTLLLQISSVGYQNLEFEYWFKVRAALEADDQVLVQWTGDGVEWEILAAYTSQPVGVWQFAIFGLPEAADDNSDLGFRLWADLTSGSDRMNFDDFVLRGQIIPEPATLGLLTLVMLAGVRRRPE